MKRIIFTLSLIGHYLFSLSQMVSGGSSHSLYLCDGNVWTSGGNLNGILGIGSNTPSSAILPLEVSNSTNTSQLTNVSFISAGVNYSLALSANGTVWSWGSDRYGNLGNNLPLADVSLPVQVLNSGLSTPFDNVHRIDAGISHSLAIKQTKTVWGWGSNTEGCLGSNFISQIVGAPVQMFNQNGTPVLMEEIQAGLALSVGLKKDSTVWTWGSNNYGAIGNPTIPLNTNQNPYPIQVQHSSGLPLDSVVQISCDEGDFVLALRADGTVWTWGKGFNGCLGNNGTSNSNQPVQVVGLNGIGVLDSVVDITSGHTTCYALRSNGTVVSWGTSIPTMFQLGYTSPTQSLYPRIIPNLNNIIDIEAGDFHLFARRSTCDIVGIGFSTPLGNFSAGSPSRTMVYTNEFSCCLPLPLEDTMGISLDTICGNGCFQAIISDQGADISYIDWSGPVVSGSSQNGDVTQLCLTSGLASGSYTIYASVHYNNSQHTSYLSFPIHVLPVPDVDLGIDQFICAGQSLQIDGTTIGALTYVWEDGSSNPIRTIASAGAYVLKVENTNGCIGVDALNVQSIESFLLTQSLCQGDTVQLDAGPEGIRYSWSPSIGLSDPNIRNPLASPSTNTTYSVSVDYPGGCSVTGNVTVNVNPVPSFDLGPDLNICSGKCFHISIPNEICIEHVEWYYYTNGVQGERQRVIIGTERELCQKPSISARYCADIIDCNGCTYTDCVTITVLPSNYPKCELLSEPKPCCGEAYMEKGVFGKNVSTLTKKPIVYPNPSPGNFTVELHSEIKQSGVIRITNALGQQVLEEQINLTEGATQHKVDITHLEKGIYIFNLLTDQNESFTKTIVRE